MAYREVLRLEIAEVVRRWQAGNSQRNIASGTSLSRDTVRKYLGVAKGAGVVQEGPDGGSVPGEVAELDFGRLGLVPDPETGRSSTV